MSEYDNTNSGALFKNDKQHDKQPDYRGSLNVGGVDYWISSWLKTSKKGDKFMSLSVQPKGEKQERQQKQQAPTPTGFEGFSDDIPF